MPIAESSPLQAHLHPLTLKRSTYDPLLDAIGNAQVVLIGDGSHGTFEFYAHRANLTQRLIEEKGFTVVALEADWPDAFRINRYIHQENQDTHPHLHHETAKTALGAFERFPKWMWKNEIMPPFIDFVKAFNADVLKDNGDSSNQVSFYGIDLYSLRRSSEEVIAYLERVDPEAAKATKHRYACFEKFGDDSTCYANATQSGMSKTCQQEAIQNLRDLIQNHRSAHLIGEINVGQRCRELFGAENVFNIGFLTDQGTVTAAYEWDEPPRLLTLNPPISQSIEKVFNETTEGDGYIITHRIEDTPEGESKKVEVNKEVNEFLNKPRYQRFIGVLYKTATEIPSHYTKCRVADQYDAVVHIKKTRGIQPLEPEDEFKGMTRGDLDMTYPFGE
ncbi:hypothetical protein EIP91_000627 [Steccherinum ochraceum]|uniref:Erythromycin esterase n=1 Tax=Steccherinum ochraceum TaxID=92696 RepID=A0A4V2MWP1_9APHY|nr:hypothetical protein EIP91_000627 [Steccherinum ochraceum]